MFHWRIGWEPGEALPSWKAYHVAQTKGLGNHLVADIEEVLQSHHLRSFEDSSSTLHRDILVHNLYLSQPTIMEKSTTQETTNLYQSDPHLIVKLSCNPPARDILRC